MAGSLKNEKLIMNTEKMIMKNEKKE